MKKIKWGIIGLGWFGEYHGDALAGLPFRVVAIPGLVDLQVNGFAGVDFLDADADGLRRASLALARTGVTAYLPTLITAPAERLVAALAEIATANASGIFGAHLEGPFISPKRLGAHACDWRRDPDLGLLKRLLVAGPVRLVTLAPELRGAHAVIHGLIEREIAVSVGHSNATAAEANAAFDLGVRTVTHVFNAMRPFSHRDPGIVGAALARGSTRRSHRRRPRLPSLPTATVRARPASPLLRSPNADRSPRRARTTRRRS